MDSIDPHFGVDITDPKFKAEYVPLMPLVLHFQRLPHAGDLPLPSRAKPGDAGLDLCSAVDAIVHMPDGVTMIPTGFAMAIPAGHVGLIMPRSGLATKHGITLANSVGVVDSGYRGEIIVALKNGGPRDFEVRRGERIVQLLVMPFAIFENVEVEALDETERGQGGFGSTGG